MGGVGSMYLGWYGGGKYVPGLVWGGGGRQYVPGLVWRVGSMCLDWYEWGG